MKMPGHTKERGGWTRLPRPVQVPDGRAGTQAADMTPVSRAAGALLHPVTLTAIVVLLLNDHAFKHAWPDTWWTGKLSDLAWMVFAPPALALVLALVVPRTRSWGSRVFVVAYFGLALLYLAYNFNEPLHDAIMASFALLTQAENMSPFDPTDAIVIPPALLLAAWVWHRGRRPPRLRPVPAMIVLVVAGLASVATSSDDPSYGITELTRQEDVLVASVCFIRWYSSDDLTGTVRDVYRSSDGGLTWRHSEDHSEALCSREQEIDRIETSRGLIELRPGEGVFLIQDEDAILEVDTSFMNDRGFQALTYDELRDRGVFVEDVSLGLFAVETVPDGENVVVATGHTGVLVGLPNGSWEWVRVGPYGLTSDFPEARQDQVRKFRSVLIIIVAGILGAAVPLLLNAIVRSHRAERPNATVWPIVSAVPLALLALIWGTELWAFPRYGSEGLIIFPYVLLIFFVLGLLFWWPRSVVPWAVLVCIAAGVLSAVAAVTLLNLWAQTNLSLVLAKVFIEVALAAFIATAFYILRRGEPKAVRG